MTDRVVTFDVEDAPRIEVGIPAGDVVIRSGRPGQVKVVLSGSSETVDGAAVDTTSDSLSIRGSSQKPRRRLFGRRMDVVVSTPDAASITVQVGSGDTRIRVAARSVDIDSARGDIRIEKDVQDVRVKIASGDVYVSQVDRELTVGSASGDIRVEKAMDATVKTASGDIVLGRIDGFGQVKSASGDIRVRDFRGPDLDISTMSGDVVVGLAPGRTVKTSIKTLSGDFRNKIEPSADDKTGTMALNISSFSGDVTLTSTK
ncbi:MAG: DUF4097 family beta strand repeat-containing protein [Actinomycetota bacterium]